MDNLKDMFLNCQGLDSFQRIGADHPLPIYVGMDSSAQYSLFCVTPTAPRVIQSSAIISVFIGTRRDGSTGITFSLTDKVFLDLFVHFCDDIIESSRAIKDLSKAAEFLANRYVQWQRAFAKNNNGFLSFQEVKGLVGELCFLKNYMIPTYGEDKAIDSWIGPDMADQDFVCDDTWFEVKSTVSGSASVSISSVEQLDTDNEGHLVIVRLDKTSTGDSSKITINNLYELVLESLSSAQLKDMLKTTLLRLGYYADKIYDAYCFRYGGMEKYKVDSSFPCARRNNFAPAVQNMKYDLSLAAISQYKED